MRTEPRPRTQALVGAVVLLVALLVVVLIYQTFRGRFGDNVEVNARIGSVGDSLTDGDIVTYRDVIIGDVTSFEPAPAGGALLRLRIEASHAGDVPAGVTAVAVPANLFGTTKVLLLPPPGDAASTGRTLRAGDSIAADASVGAKGLQTALGDLYTLLTAVRPADLNAALSALASALEGRGADIGRLIDRTSSLLTTLSPSLPDLTRTLERFAATTELLARTAPDLLGALSNALTPAAAIVRRQGALRELLAVGPVAVDDARALVERIGGDTVTVITNARPVLQALADNPSSLGDSVTGFRNVAQALNSVIRNGRANANVVVTGVNTAALLPLLLGQPSSVITGAVDPRGYTSADCPRYPGADGPNCTSSSAGGASSAGAVVLQSGGAAVGRTGGRVGSVGSASEQRTVRMVISSLTGRPIERVPAAMDLLLAPLLRGAPAVLR